MVLARQRLGREAGSQSETISHRSSAGRGGRWADGSSVSTASSIASFESASETVTFFWRWRRMGGMEGKDSGVDEVRSAWSSGLKDVTGC
jgi:hypothetical protein